MNNFIDTFYQNFYNVNNITDLEEQKKIQQDLISPEEGFRRGNIFQNLFWPYAKHTYSFRPENERQSLLLQIMQYAFYAHELNLYLDTHPEDTERINLFMQYNNMTNNLVDQYEKLYTPITLEGNNLNSSPWVWATTPWPWEGV